MNMHKKSYWLAMALLLAVMTLAACGGGGSTGGESGEAPNVPASDAAAGAQAGGTGTDTGTGDTVTEGANGSNDASGAGDASGGNAGNDAGSATDVGSGSDGAQGSGGSNGASGTTSPESETGAPTEGDAAGNTESGTGTDASGAQGGTAGGAATGTGDNNAQVAGTGAGGAYTAVADGECTEIQGQLTTALGVEVSRATGAASFSDLSGGTGESCQLTITGTGVQFPSIVDAAQRISQVLTENGWTADPQYAADSPTATIGGLRRDNQLAAYNVEWSPADGVTCPADQPISACAETLTPDQMNYNITIDLAQQ
jgi:hypothetical protein